MEVVDIPRVTAIERDVFPSPWPAHAYRYELTQNTLSHCYILEREDELVGYGCLWLVVDEAHISTLAVATSQRGHGLGELLLLALLYESIALQAVTATLEVRVSNKGAQALYAKYGFDTVGWRKRYYTDNQEDALIMTVDPLDQIYQDRLASLQATLFKRLSAAR